MAMSQTMTVMEAPVPACSGCSGGLRKRALDQACDSLWGFGQVMEAVMHGAGGMDLIDPLFQHVLASSAKARKVPVVMDEVFAGLWRLGRQSPAASLVRLSMCVGGGASCVCRKRAARLVSVPACRHQQ
jgi:hypothetical protein